MDGGDQAGTSTGGGEARCDALGEAIAAVLGGAIRDFDARASGVGRRQEDLSLSLDRVTLGSIVLASFQLSISFSFLSNFLLVILSDCFVSKIHPPNYVRLVAEIIELNAYRQYQI